MSSDPLESTPAVAPRRRRWQWNLWTIILLTAAVGGWTAYFEISGRTEKTRAEIETLETLARRLTVGNPDQFAVVEPHPVWHDDNRFQVYLPAGRTYRLKVATRQIDDNGLAEPRWQAAIEPGEHEIAIVQKKLPDDEGWQVTVTVDGQTVIEGTEPVEWNDGSGWSGGGGHSRVTQLPLDKPLILQRRRFSVAQPGGGSRSPNRGPVNGMLLWIEKQD